MTVRLPTTTGSPSTFLTLALVETRSAKVCNSCWMSMLPVNHGRGLVGAAAPDQPRLDGAGILQDLGFEFLELGVEDGALDGRSEELVTRLHPLLLDEGQNCLGELQSVYRVAHSPCLLHN